MKSSKTIIYILLVLVVLFGIGYAVKKVSTTKNVNLETPSANNSTTGVITPTENAKTPTSKETPASLNDLLSLNKPQVCTWSQTVEGMDIVPTIYINGKSFRQEMSLGDKGTFYALSDGTTMYSWSDASTVGVKMNFNDLTKTAEDLKSTNPDLANTTNVDMNKDYNFSCSGWTVDPSKFTVPSDIQFVDIANFTGGLQDMMQNLDLNK